MLTIKADVYFFSEAEDGLNKNGVSDMQPSFSVADDLIMCKVIAEEGVDEFVLGKNYSVTIELPYGDMFSNDIQTGYKFSLHFGGKEFARGVVS